MKRIALFLPNLTGGGAERVTVNLARGLCERGVAVDLVPAAAEGPLLAAVDPRVRLVDLRCRRTVAAVPKLARYLRQERPVALLSAIHHANLVALWARRWAGVRVRVVVALHTTLSRALALAPSRTGRLVARMAGAYRAADGVVAVSHGVADDFAHLTGFPRERLTVIYNPTILPELPALAAQPLAHPWFAAGEPPVVLGVGRLIPDKDFPTLLRAAARVQAERPLRVLILGEGAERARLQALIDELEMDAWAALPGFVDNPYPYLAHAALFVLSSVREGLPGALIEALALGTPVAACDCESGPREILAGGRYGPLLPLGDVDALAAAMQAILDHPPPPPPREAWEPYTLARATDDYLHLLEGTP